jgi:hypothetical protein
VNKRTQQTALLDFKEICHDRKVSKTYELHMSQSPFPSSFPWHSGHFHRRQTVLRAADQKLRKKRMTIVKPIKDA